LSMEYPNLMHSYGGLLQPGGHTPLTSTFNAEHFKRRLSWSIGAIHFWNVYRSLK